MTIYQHSFDVFTESIYQFVQIIPKSLYPVYWISNFFRMYFVNSLAYSLCHAISQCDDDDCDL